jgi:hypothetical protein
VENLEIYCDLFSSENPKIRKILAEICICTFGSAIIRYSYKIQWI